MKRKILPFRGQFIPGSPVSDRGFCLFLLFRGRFTPGYPIHDRGFCLFLLFWGTVTANRRITYHAISRILLYPASLHRQGCSHCLLVEIFHRYQLNFTTLLCLKKSIRESAFREDIIMIVVTFSKYRCVIPNQIKLIHAYFSHFCTCTNR